MGFEGEEGGERIGVNSHIRRIKSQTSHESRDSITEIVKE